MKITKIDRKKYSELTDIQKDFFNTNFFQISPRMFASHLKHYLYDNYTMDDVIAIIISNTNH